MEDGKGGDMSGVKVLTCLTNCVANSIHTGEQLKLN